MHTTARINAELFFKTYVATDDTKGRRIVEIGSMDVNGSLRQFCPTGAEYIGVDFQPGPGVDEVLDNPYQLPFEDEWVDYCLASSVFEHSEMFWILFVEILRVLKPSGLLYMQAPSNGAYHRFPLDCWRFYPDSGIALVHWAEASGYTPALLESYTSMQQGECWNDFVAVFLKDVDLIDAHRGRITNSHPGFANAMIYPSPNPIRMNWKTEDMLKIERLQEAAAGNSPVAEQQKRER